MDAVPLDVDTWHGQIWWNHVLAADAYDTFEGHNEHYATQYIFDNYAHLTTGRKFEKVCETHA